MSGLSFLRDNGAIRCTNYGGMSVTTKRQWLKSYQRMLETGTDPQGQRLGDAAMKQIEIQAGKWRAELGE